MQDNNLTISRKQIIEGERFRKDYGDLETLVDSIEDVGLIQPLVLTRNSDGNTYTLVAGGRRLRACDFLKLETFHHSKTATPGQPGFVFQNELTESTLRELELEENLHRLEMSWIEKVLLVHRIHTAKRQEKGLKWGERQTAAILGRGFSRASIGNALRVGKALLAGDKELQACQTLDEANCLLIKRNEDKALAELQARTQALLPKELKETVDTSSFLDSINLSTKKPTEKSYPPVLPTDPTTPLTPQENIPQTTIPLSKMFQCGDFQVVLPQIPDSSVDHVVTDIPYGIDMDMLDEKQVASVKDTHDVEQNVEMMPVFLREAFRVLKPSGFCVFFYDLDHHEKLQGWANEVGFKVQRWPFIACKTSACQNNASQYNSTKNYEVAMFLRKDAHSVLRKPLSTSWRTYDFAAERKTYSNPFAKPFQLWKDIYDTIAFPGQTVLDPFCGEMSACRAAINCGLTPLGIELDPKHFNRGLEHVKGAYALLHRNNVAFI